MQGWEFAIAYHEETKHHYRRYARSAGHLDWANQPDPFRRYAGCAVLPLVHSAAEGGPAYDELYVPGAIAAAEVDQVSVSLLFEYALALSAWKEFKGARWALRVNPSSGNLHPTEGYLVCGTVAGIIDRPGVFHYAPREHALERRATFSAEAWGALIAGFPAGTLFVGLTSIHWREAWKYGERGYRYCQHDAGHAAAAVALAAALNGWRVHPLNELSDEEAGALLGVSRDEDYGEAERESPDLVVAVVREDTRRDVPHRLNCKVEAWMNTTSWHGRANRLSAERVTWELIDAVADACRKGGEAKRSRWRASVEGLEASEGRASRDVPLRVSLEFGKENAGHTGPMEHDGRRAVAARRIIRQRRSAVALDGRTALSARAFYEMMRKVMPRWDAAPWSALGPPACVHLGLFVHRVEEVDSGLYILARDARRIAELREALRGAWERPTGCPGELPLFRLARGNYREMATQVSCTQEIAGDGAFSCGMIAEFERPLRGHGAWFYRRLFWETGMIGQVLYLEAEAAGVRGTGIGCYFDDPVHEVFGLKGRGWQSLYHFTVGGAVEDTRLTTLPAYPGRSGRQERGSA